jgi:hypothetical protein
MPMKTTPDEYTTDQVQKFLDTFVATGSMSKACEIAGICRETHYARIINDRDYERAFGVAYRRLGKDLYHLENGSASTLPAEMSHVPQK